MLHFVGFKGDEFWRAKLVFGPPDFIHRWADERSRQMTAPGDTVIFANGEETKDRPYVFDDSQIF